MKQVSVNEFDKKVYVFINDVSETADPKISGFRPKLLRLVFSVVTEDHWLINQILTYAEADALMYCLKEYLDGTTNT